MKTQIIGLILKVQFVNMSFLLSSCRLTYRHKKCEALWHPSYEFDETSTRPQNILHEQKRTPGKCLPFSQILSQDPSFFCKSAYQCPMNGTLILVLNCLLVSISGILNLSQDFVMQFFLMLVNHSKQEILASGGRYLLFS